MLQTSVTWRKRPLMVSVSEEGLTIGPQGLSPYSFKWEDVWEMMIVKEERDPQGWTLIAKGKYYIQMGVNKLDPIEEGVSTELVKEAVLNLNAAMWRG